MSDLNGRWAPIVHGGAKEIEPGDPGGIAIDRQGRIGWRHNSPHFAIALIESEMDAPGVWLKKEEDIAAHG
jgi:isoaspartyl peptidase/L-asparaginase-like protein (Ntn-hydrolase superfamily)